MDMGLRERKKRETRQRISNVATELFIARGFDAVTVAEIAEAAEVSKMTVFNYFPRKEDLYLDRHEEIIEVLTTAITGRGELSVTAAVRRMCHQLTAANHALSGAVDGFGRFWSVINASPALQLRLLEHLRDTEEALVDLLGGQRDPRAWQIAGMLLATVRAVFYANARAILDGTPAKTVARRRAHIDRAFDLLESGVGQDT
ncbi:MULTISPECIES: TetR/AcrR family transcriptional regulator [unclassified Crossiella]|uniref:TetR/AcrR family transcriptional regulator n=1 Tax=unclassified Crossiella TaxID=2620835 RepID=UPI001FFF71D8|nr:MULTISPECIES: TetR family transcriptional regulator [unclassified Crossiella]MCK2244908.1 TetR/AcrR family transcriptional regulator [Crossiella sp. S99.2]MCK2258539.1 TetR/AcrR family transcriptional regulator [Crossiella sp. S99.1]